MIKSAASAASPRRGRASGRLDHGLLFAIFGRASGEKIIKISDSTSPGMVTLLDKMLLAGPGPGPRHAPGPYPLADPVQNDSMLLPESLKSYLHHAESEILTFFWLLARPKIAKKTT